MGDELIEITDFDPTEDTMAIQFHENDVRDISVHPVSDDVLKFVWAIRWPPANHLRHLMREYCGSNIRKLFINPDFQYTRPICENNSSKALLDDIRLALTLNTKETPMSITAEEKAS